MRRIVVGGYLRPVSAVVRVRITPNKEGGSAVLERAAVTIDPDCYPV